MNKALKVRIYPTNEQLNIINKNLGSARFVYNYFLALRTEKYKEEGVSLSYSKTSSLLTKLKHTEEYNWLCDVDSMSLQEALKNLDRAYKSFFDGNNRFPCFHSKRGKQSYRTRNQKGSVAVVDNKIKLPKIGLVKCKGLREMDGRILNATVSRSASGKYYVSLCYEMEDSILPNEGGVIGIDVGLKEFYTDSNNHSVPNPKSYRKNEKKLIREQRRLKKKKKGSNNRNKQRIKLARQHEKVANIRNDFLQKQSTILANENQVVCVEDLNVKGMLRNHKLAKSISDVSWSKFFYMLEYKTAERNSLLVKVPTFYPSSQTCSVCGYKNPLVKNLSVRNWVCPDCLTEHDRDHNAALNILKKGLEILST